jgi:hypothetical protein
MSMATTLSRPLADAAGFAALFDTVLDQELLGHQVLANAERGWHVPKEHFTDKLSATTQAKPHTDGLRSQRISGRRARAASDPIGRAAPAT